MQKEGIKKNARVFEWSGVITAILYSILVALNIGAEVIAFFLLISSATLIGFWAYLCNHHGILLLQAFYALAGVIGVARWM